MNPLHDIVSKVSNAEIRKWITSKDPEDPVMSHFDECPECNGRLIVVLNEMGLHISPNALGREERLALKKYKAKFKKPPEK